MNPILSNTSDAVTHTVSDTVDRLNVVLNTIFSKILGAIPNLILGVVILSIGLFLIRTLLNLLDKYFAKKNLDLSLRGFLRSVVKFILYTLLILTVVSNIGIQTTSFIAIFTAIGLGVGASLQGSLSNFAGGVLILIFRPYEVGDYIENNSSTEGTVLKIDLLYTTLVNSSGITVFSPNGPLANSVIHNYSKITNRRFEYSVRIAYEDNIKTAKDIIAQVLKGDSRVLKTPEIEIFVNNLGDSAVNLTVRGWAMKADYWAARYQLQEDIKVALDKAGFTNPYPQREMHIVSDVSNINNDKQKREQ
ncbi:mechanosensitive ion channel [Flavobacterium agricola]|uniref:Mechanosensitive ion channel n=1 Tax=Flavobacterium agricola TaxID=2870839 RepID=A0ABY6LWV3_9FLAO|nr:mechanosensitive ion channel domain-containing protein [Flavobacterium agricola]UYW00828.1 mechanosensitive ion channel [Flavobacterium agricola]